MKIHTIFFDLDDTLYPNSSGLWPEICKRMEMFMHQKLNLPWVEIPVIRQTYHRQYGTTLRGLQAEYQVEPGEYLAYVHDLPLEHFLRPEPGIREMLLSLPQRRLIFTNADAAHASRVLSVLGLSDCFEQIIDVLAISPFCKPFPGAFQIALAHSGTASAQGCVMLDDTLHNLAGAREMGFATIWLGSSQPADGVDAAISRLADLPAALATLEARQ